MPRSQYQNSGLTRSEREILDLWDAGQSIERIARELRCSKSTVASKVSMFAELDETRRHKTGMATGSAALLAAMRASTQIGGQP